MNVYVLNTLGAGLDTVGLLSAEVEIRGIIGLTERSVGDAISGYVYQREFCESRGIDFVPIESYALKDAEDRARLEALEIDVLVVAGWQRLIPDWLIERCRHCAIGVHGSPYGITGGRGRSPQNWAFILGEKEFHVSIFKIDPGIDSGDIIDSASFELTEHDDIRTSYYKVSSLMARMIIRSLRSGKIERGEFEKQDETGASYLPQRLPEDGAIDWRRPSARIRDFVRALTRPYPGASTSIDGHNVRIWRALPFEASMTRDHEPGEIVKIFSRGDVLVATGDGFLLVESYTTDALDDGTAFELREGEVFESDSHAERMETIVRRHREKHPNLPLAPAILREAKISVTDCSTAR